MKPLIVPGVLDSLASIRAYVLDAAAAAGLDKKTAYRLGLAVDEIATNIVNYGYAEAGITGDIAVHSSIDGNALTITLDDSAQPFDPLQYAVPDDLDQPIEHRQIGGLGVYLAIKGVDKFTYERVDNHNHNTFIVYRPAGG